MGSNFVGPTVGINIVRKIGDQPLLIQKNDSDEILKLEPLVYADKSLSLTIRVLSNELREGMVSF